MRVAEINIRRVLLDDTEKNMGVLTHRLYVLFKRVRVRLHLHYFTYLSSMTI